MAEPPMTSPAGHELVERARAGDPRSSEALLETVYAKLRQLAEDYLRGERQGHSLQPTALVHEAYLRIVGGAPVDWENRRHFFRVAATTMRRVLVQHARARGRVKRGGERRRVTLQDPVAGNSEPVDLLLVDEALEALRGLDERQANVVELRFFGGLSSAEAAAVLGVSERTVRDDWATARAWLRWRLSSGSGS